MQYRAELPFHQLTVKFLEEYKFWLQKVYEKKGGKRLDKNTIWKALSFIRMVYKQAIRDEIVMQEDYPFKAFDAGRYEQNIKKVKYLSMPEIEAIEHLLTRKNNMLDKLTISIGWRFLAMCVSGMRISDAMVLDGMELNDTGDLEFTPHKTRRHGNTAFIPVSSDRQRRYLQQTLARPVTGNGADAFRVLFNNHLKIICAAAGIPCFTSHSGRHTMGSLLVDAGIQEKAAMAMLGIKNNEVIKGYLHLKESKLRSEAEKLRNVM